MKRPSGRRSSRSSGLPLAGLTVLDLTRILSGPFCTMKLGDMGAEVIKIEHPNGGDETRKWGPPFVKGESAYFLSVNRNKKSVTLDLKSEKGKEILIRLIKRSDVLVENFRAGVMRTLGFDYPIVRVINPRLVYCSISGYGQTSNRSHHPSYDLIVQGESGLMDLTGFPDGAPTKAGISLADVNAGNLAFEGILLALLRRARTGTGDHVDISLLDAMASLFTYQTQMALSTSQKALRMGNRHPSITPYETFATKDGYINIAVAGEGQWKSFCGRIGVPELAADRRFAVNALRVKNRAALEKILIPILRRKPSKAWLAVLKEADVPAGKLNSVAEMLSQPDMRERGMILSLKHRKAGTLRMVGNPIKLAFSSPAAMKAPPLLGEDTESVLSALGYSRNDFRRLLEEQIV